VVEVEIEEARDLLADTRLERVREASDGAPALYRGSLTAAWNAQMYPFGGIVSAIALRAMRDELALPAHAPRSLTTLFCSPVVEGPLEVEVRTLRRGRGMSQLQATVRSAGDPQAGHTTFAVFGAARPGVTFTDATPPDVPPPEACPPPPEPPPGVPGFRPRFFDQLEVRPWGMKASWETDWEAGGPARAIRWMRYRRPPRRRDGTHDPVAYVPVCDTMPPSILQRLGPGARPFLAPSCDLNVHLLGETKSEWWLVDARTHHAADGYTSSTIALWDEDGRLLARASQTIYLRMDAPELQA
jgi:acyl-CoA thioesterase